MNRIVFVLACFATVVMGATMQRQFGFPAGGFIPIAVNDEQLLDCMDFVVEQLNSGLNNSLSGDNYFQKEKILYAMRQIVAGLNYKVTFLITETACKRNDQNLSDCLGMQNLPTSSSLFNKKLCVARLFQSLPDQSSNKTHVQVLEAKCY